MSQGRLDALVPEHGAVVAELAVFDDALPKRADRSRRAPDAAELSAASEHHQRRRRSRGDGGRRRAAHRTAENAVWVLAFGVGITSATIWLRYVAIARILKWLALVLAVYVLAAIDVRPDWGAVLRDTAVPHLPRSREAWATLVAILGTTISPYLFFWQASQEVEEEKAAGHRTLKARRGATPEELAERKIDIGLGTLFSNLAMFFIIVTTASTLHTRRGSARQIAEQHDLRFEPDPAALDDPVAHRAHQRERHPRPSRRRC